MRLARNEIMAIAMIVFASEILVFPLLQSPLNFGYDIPVHLSRAKYLLDYGPYVEWNWWWGFGIPFNLYPPITYLLLALFFNFSSSIEVGYAALVAVVFPAVPLLIYVLLRQMKVDIVESALAALVFLTSWAYFDTYFIWGTLPNNIALAFLILTLAMFVQGLKYAQNSRLVDAWTVRCGLLVGIIALTHHLTIFSLIIIFTIILAVNPSDLSKWRLFLKMLIIASIGLAVSAYFIFRFAVAVVLKEIYFPGVFFGGVNLNKLLISTQYFYDHPLFLGYHLGASTVIIAATLIVAAAKGRWKKKSFRWFFVICEWIIFFTLMAFDIFPNPIFQELGLSVTYPPVRSVVFLAFSLAAAAGFALHNLKYYFQHSNLFRMFRLAFLSGLLIVGCINAINGIQLAADATPMGGIVTDVKRLVEYMNHSDGAVIMLSGGGSALNLFCNRTQSDGGEIQAEINSDARWLLIQGLHDSSLLRNVAEATGSRYVVIDPAYTATYDSDPAYTKLCTVGLGTLYELNISSTDLVVAIDGTPTYITYQRLRDKVLIEVAANSSVKLLVRTSYYRGWSARIDGVSLPIRKSYAGLIEIEFRPSVSGVKHKIVLEYKTTEGLIGNAVSAIAIVTSVSFILWKIRGRFRTLLIPKKRDEALEKGDTQ